MALAHVSLFPVKSPARNRLDLALVVPTYNERGNVAELIRRLDATLQGLAWEVIFVDDDSPDGTADLVRSFARTDRRIRVIHRIGRRGLASACVEGIMATSAEIVGVMDGDLQHDESILPAMLDRLRDESLDVVIGTRNAVGGSMGDFAAHRVAISRLGRKLSHAVCRARLSDPMSGYFLVTRGFFMETVAGLQNEGFKILVDLFASSPRPVRFGEVGYTFRCRHHGESKFDLRTGVEFLFLILNKLLAAAVRPRFVVFSMVGAIGVVTHLLALGLLLYAFHSQFFFAQAIATYIAMTGNFFINNAITYRDRSLRGAGLVTGLASFWIACSFGAWANVILARALLADGRPWYLAGLAGMTLSSFWNYTISYIFTWHGSSPSSRIDPADPDAELIRVSPSEGLEATAFSSVQMEN